MTINSYSTLRTAVSGAAPQSWSHRTDTLGQFDNFLLMAEEKMYKHLRIRDQEVRTTDTLSTSSRFLSLPTRYLELRKLELEYSNCIYPLQYRTPDAMERQTVSQRPLTYTITSQFEFDAVPDVAYTLEIEYMSSLAALSSSNTTNAILTRFPSIYLYGCLEQMFKWAHNIEKATLMAGEMDLAIKDANDSDARGRSSNNPQMIVKESVA